MNQKILSEQSKTVNDGRRSKPSVWECSEVIFRDAENSRQADISHPKTSLHSEGETIRSHGRRLGNSIEEWKSWKRWDCRQIEDKIEG